MPSTSVESVNDPEPPEHVLDPTSVAPEYIFSVLPFVQVELIVGVLSLVLLSVLDEPVSLDAKRSGVPLAAGEVVSMVTESVEESLETLPAGSVCFAFTRYTPSVVSAELVIETVDEAHVPVPRTVAPDWRLTEAPVSQLTVKVGVLSLVTLSVLKSPVSEPAWRSGVPVVPGVDVSMVTARVDESDETFVAASVCLALSV